MTDAETIATLRGLIESAWGAGGDSDPDAQCPWCFVHRAFSDHDSKCPAAQAMGWRMRA